MSRQFRPDDGSGEVKSSVSCRASELEKSGDISRSLLKTRKRIRNLIHNRNKGNRSERKQDLLNKLNARVDRLVGGGV